MKRIFCILSCVCMLLVAGCTSSYKRDTSAGKVINITVTELQEKVANKDTFAVVFTQTTCAHCKVFMQMLEEYLPTHNITLYDVVLDTDPIVDLNEKLAIIRPTFPTMDGTPMLYYVKDGVMENEFVNGDDGITEARFDDWIQELQLDKK